MHGDSQSSSRRDVSATRAPGPGCAGEDEVRVRTQVSKYLSWPPSPPTTLPGGGGGVLRQSLFLSGQTARKSEVRQVALSLLLTGDLIQDTQVTAASLLSLRHTTTTTTPMSHYIQLWNFAQEIERCDWSLSGISTSHWLVLIKTKRGSRPFDESLGRPRD